MFYFLTLLVTFFLTRAISVFNGHKPCTRITLRYQYNPFDHPRAVRSSVRDFNKNPYKPYIYWKLNNYRLWPDLFKTVEIYRVSKMWIYLQSFTNHKSRYTPAQFKSEKTINIASVSSHIDLKNRVSDFWHMRLSLFYKRIKLEKGKK